MVGDQRFAFLIALREWLSFQAYTVCTQSQERACGSSPVQVSAVVPRDGGSEEGLNWVTREA